MNKPDSIDHVVLIVKDIKKTTDFYYQAFLEDLKEVGVDPNSIKFQKVTDPDVIQEIHAAAIIKLRKQYKDKLNAPANS
jgi:catechol 2,3-dioxygenase-like lactoylglutathione lyase family enzyme